MVVSARHDDEIENESPDGQTGLPSPEVRKDENPELDLLKLKSELEKGDLNEEKRLKLYADTLNDVLGANPRLILKDLELRLDKNEEGSELDKEVLTCGTSLLAGIADFKGLEFNSAKDLAKLFRDDPDPSLRTFSETLVHLIARSDSPLGAWFQMEGWDESLRESHSLSGAMTAVRDSVKPSDKVEDKKKKNPEDEVWYEKAFDYCKENPAQVALGVGVGAAGLGVLYMGFKSLFGEKKDSSPIGIAKTAATVGLASFATGQVLGMDSVRKFVAENCPSWAYNLTQGLAAFADLEGSTGIDYLTGNGPDASDQNTLEHLSSILKVPEGRIWNTGKLKFNEFMDGKSASMFSFFGGKKQEDDLREEIKDLYLDDLKVGIPELNDPESSKDLTLQDVLFKGYQLGIIKTKDRTDLSEDDRQTLTERGVKDQKEKQEVESAFDNPRENISKMKEVGENLLTRLDVLDASVDDYWGELGASIEDFIGFDFDFGADNSEEYRDLRAAGDSLKAFYKEGATKDHLFFEEKKERVKAYLVFLEKHKDEDPWSPSTLEEFEGTKSKKGYKEEMLELDRTVRSSLARAEEDNLKKRAEDNEKIGTLSDLEDGAKFLAVGVSGICSALQFRLEKLQEGSTFYWSLTIAQAVGVTYEFGRDSKMAAPLKLGKGLFVDPAYYPGKLTYKAFNLRVNPYKALSGLRYSSDELLEKLLTHEMTADEVKTRAYRAEKYKSSDPRFWKRIGDKNKAAVEMQIKEVTKLAELTTDVRLMEEYVDGRIKLEDIHNEELRSLLQAIEVEDLERIRASRCLRQIKIAQAKYYDEIVSHLKSGTPLSIEAETALKGLNLSPESETALKKVIKKPEGEKLLKKLSLERPDVVRAKAEFVSTSTDGSTHNYKFGGQEVALSETEVSARAAEFEAIERSAGLTPDPVRVRERAVQSLAEERFVTPVETAPGSGMYRFAGQEFKFTEAEILKHQATRVGMTHEEAVRELAMRKSFAHMPVEAARQGMNGKFEYKIGKEWISADNVGERLTEQQVRAKFEEHLSKEQIAKLPNALMDAKVLKTFQFIEKLGGTAMAVTAIYMMETATDKRKAVCEFMTGAASFMAGAKASEFMLVKRFGTPKTPTQVVLHFLFSAGAGLATAYGIAEPLESFLDPYIAKIPASHAVGGEFASLIEKGSMKSLTGMAMGSLEKGLLKEGVLKIAGKMGIEGLESAFERKVGAALLERIGVMAAKRGFQDILLSCGWKGTASLVMVADDATVIGVADDIIAAGFVIWMAKDIIDVVRLVLNALAVQNQMEERKKHRITSFDIKDPKGRAAFQEKLLSYGLTIDRATELTEDQFFDILRTVPSVRIEFTRENTLGHEEWLVQNGEAKGISIFDEKNGVVAEMTDEDATDMELKLNELEKQRRKKLNS